MEEKIILEKMAELSKKIDYSFKDIRLLAKAMNATKTEKRKNADEYMNDALATVGDAMLKALLADELYRKNPHARKGEITAGKAELENNKILSEIMDKESLRQFTYNTYGFWAKNQPSETAVRSTEHDPYIEEIVGAIYYDGGWDTMQEWFESFLLPLLKKYR